MHSICHKMLFDHSFCFFPFILLINLRVCQSSELNQMRSNASRKGYSLFNMKFALNKFRLMFQIAPYFFLLGLLFLFATFDYTYTWKKYNLLCFLEFQKQRDAFYMENQSTTLKNIVSLGKNWLKIVLCKLSLVYFFTALSFCS